jgi:membrane fusion protein (multidrug efflux system)
MSDMTVYPYKGKVDFSSPTYDQGTGTLQVRAVFPNPEGLLRPGQFVRVKVYGAERPNAVYVPQRALLQKTNGMFVYLIDKDDKVVLQDVSTGEWYGEYEVISNGLKVGDRIVVDGITKIVPGSKVHVTGEWEPKDKNKLISTHPN